ncbi:MAG TPA: hypothetical protein VN578_21115 [Candidatus Binatia bacterium]|jgi:hypothetical protein|nr:hypothetical protein [Candidatus Binatia bacterium]
MELEYNYTCPNCSNDCVVAASLAGQNVTCPNCSNEFFATPPENPLAIEVNNGLPPFTIPAKLPFFKSHRRPFLESRLQEMMAFGGGSISKIAEDELNKNAIVLGFDSREGSKLIGEHFMREFEPIKKRMEDTLLMTDDDLAAIDQLKKKYNATLTLEGNAQIFREIYVIESTGKLPPPIVTSLMLGEKETAYYAVITTWHQTRVHTHGYSGSSVSIPTGIKGVSFGFGQYTPIKTEDLTPLSVGTLYVTSARLLFEGETRNTSITFKRIVDCHIYADALRVEKGTGKPDYFPMTPPQARYIVALIGALK